MSQLHGQALRGREPYTPTRCVFVRADQVLRKTQVIMAGILYFLLAGYVFAANSSGAREYMDNCARCHGADAKGNGPDANSKPGYHPADLTEITKHHGDKFPRQEIYDVIDGDKRLPGHYNFNSPMPLWG
jgi:mono/diheme cytochrome c family protein